MYVYVINEKVGICPESIASEQHCMYKNIKNLYMQTYIHVWCVMNMFHFSIESVEVCRYIQLDTYELKPSWTDSNLKHLQLWIEGLMWHRSGPDWLVGWVSLWPGILFFLHSLKRSKVNFMLCDTFRCRTTWTAQIGSFIFLSYNTIC
jgi:hypothetical protein